MRRALAVAAIALELTGCDANHLLGGPRRAACADTITIRLDTLERVDSVQRVRCP
jgi:hypothetical protein